MGLNPGGYSESAQQLRQKVLDDNFNGGSPYFGMFSCGYYGVPIDDCINKCNRNGIVIRKKDIQAWKDGDFKRSLRGFMSNNHGETYSRIVAVGKQFEEMKLEDFPSLPIGWQGTERRFFPCSEDNKPMQKWGWSRDYTPMLYLAADARALSPCGWIGQNMLYQTFIVFDIDGRGHGCEDRQVIEFGNQFKEVTMTMEDPQKPGSFHLYFKTDKLIPVRHFPYAKLDLMGNAVNAAVYLKNKKSNDVPPMMLDNNIWSKLMAYQKSRKEIQCL